MDQLEYIDSFFKNELPPEEIRRFEKRIIDDPTFAGDVAFYCRSMQVVKEQLNADKKSRFRKLYNQKTGDLAYSTGRQPVIKKLTRYFAAAAIFAALMVGWFLFVKPESPRQLADQFISGQLDTLAVTMSSKQDSMQAAIELYNSGKYREALQSFENISQKHPNDVEAKKFTGIVYLRTNEYDKAISVFKQVESRKDLYSNPGKFYHALTLLKRNREGDEEEAQRLLNEVVEQDLDEKETAQQWLKKF